MAQVTVEVARTLEFGDMLFSRSYTNADGTPQRFKVNGKVKLWKTRPDEYRIPVKRGMYEHGYVEEHNGAGFDTDEDEAARAIEARRSK